MLFYTFQVHAWKPQKTGDFYIASLLNYWSYLVLIIFRLDMADNHLCLLCLQVFNNCDDDDDDDTVAKSYQRIRIETLFELLSPFHSNHKSVTNQYEFAEDKVCEFCQDCYPFVATVEEIRKQISLLEEELGRKVGQIRTTILHPSSFPQNSDDYEIMKIRDKILVLTG